MMPEENYPCVDDEFPEDPDDVSDTDFGPDNEDEEEGDDEDE